MDLQGLMPKYGDYKFNPHGKDRSGVYMIIDKFRIHIRQDDLPLVQGLALRDAWPLVDKVELAEQD